MVVALTSPAASAQDQAAAAAPVGDAPAPAPSLTPGSPSEPASSTVPPLAPAPSTPSTPSTPELDPREAYLTPAPDRSAVRVETSIPGVTVGVARDDARGGTREQRATELFWRLCRAPCTVYVRPGSAHVVARGEGVVPSVSDVTVGPNEALRVRLNVRRRSVADAQTGLYASGAVLALAGVVTGAVGWSSMQSGRPAAFIVGVSMASVGVGLIVSALIAGAANPMGVAEVAPAPRASAAERPRRRRAAAPPPWASLAFAPHHGVALVLGGAL